MDRLGSSSILSQLNSLRLSDGTKAGDRLRAGTTPPTVGMPKIPFAGDNFTGGKGSGTGASLRPIGFLPTPHPEDKAPAEESAVSPRLLAGKELLSSLCAARPTAATPLDEAFKDNGTDSGLYLHHVGETNTNDGPVNECRPVDIKKRQSPIMIPKPHSGVKSTFSSPIMESKNVESHGAIGSNDAVGTRDMIPITESDFPITGKKNSPQRATALLNVPKNKESRLPTTEKTSGVENSDDTQHRENTPYNQNKGDREQKKFFESSPFSVSATPYPQGFFPAFGFSDGERFRALEANRFVAEALDNLFIDNNIAYKPIIRTLPTLTEGGRYIVVGDVHGCVAQLEALVKKVQYKPGKDCLIIIGDYVNKGPDSIGVIRACQKLRAVGVLGNHDFTLIQCCKQGRRKPFTEVDLRDPVKKLAAMFPLDCEFYLRSLPHILRMPKYNVLLVHAGLNVSCPLEEQNVIEIMNMRRLKAIPHEKDELYSGDTTEFKAIIKGKDGVPWVELWNGPELVVFGHDARTGFQEKPLAYGIDTGCVYGHSLTCVVFSEDHPKGEFFYVNGLPKDTNALMGMPPPVSHIYEEAEEAIEEKLIRPSRRTMTTGTLSSLSPFLTPCGPLFPTAMVPLPSSPPTPSYDRQFRTQSSSKTMALSSDQKISYESIHEAQKTALLSLSAAEELRALAVLMNLPAYDEMMSNMLSDDMNNREAQESFWLPFSRNVLKASLLLTPQVHAGNGIKKQIDVEDIVQYVLGVCADMVAVKAKVLPELYALLTHANCVSKNDRRNHWKGIAKYIEVLLT